MLSKQDRYHYFENTYSIKKLLLIDGLKYNLVSIKQLCDKDFNVKFLNNMFLLDLHDKLMLEWVRVKKIYIINLNNL